MPLKIGDKAPSFALYDSDRQEVNLEDFLGQKLVLYFFPLAFSGGCSKEVCLIRDQMSGYDEVKAVVLAISVDSPMSLAKFKETYGLNFIMLSDFNKEVSRAYDVLYEEFILELKGVAKRSAFVIDQNGVIRYVEVLEKASEMPDFSKINYTLSALI